MRGERGEVDVEVDEVHGHMRDGLAGVEHDVRADGASPIHEAVDRVDRAEDVGDVRERKHLRRFVDDRVEIGQVELSRVGHGQPAQLRSRGGGELLPRHEIRVMLHLGDDDRVAGNEREASRFLSPEAVAGTIHAERHDVERLGGVLRPAHLLRCTPDESGGGDPTVLERVGGLDGQGMRAPVDGGIALAEVLDEGVDDALRLLRRRAGVQIRQRRLPDPHIEDREVAPQT